GHRGRRRRRHRRDASGRARQRLSRSPSGRTLGGRSVSGADTTTSTDGTAGPARTRSVLVPVGAFVVWTLFVWIGRIRNAVTDTALSGSDRIGPLVLSGIFVVGALVLGALLYRDHAMRSAASARMLRNAVRVFAGYT